jgi:HEAT repeat protein
VPKAHDDASANARRIDVAIAGRANDVEAVRTALSDAMPSVRAAALSELARSGEITAADVANAIRDPHAIVRRRICELSTSCPEGDFGLLLADHDGVVVEAAAFACGEQAIASSCDALIEVATNHADALCRESSVAALGVLGDPAGLPTILAALHDVAAVRRRAVIALANYESPEATAGLEAAMNDRDWQVRQAAEDILGINRTSTH